MNQVRKTELKFSLANFVDFSYFWKMECRGVFRTQSYIDGASSENC